MRKFFGGLFLLALSGVVPVLAQGNYEIQVYGADTVQPGTTMVELHSNFTVNGQRYEIQGVYPTYHQEHETLEITQGINDWAEVGFYIFTSEQNGHGVQWVGDHIRPRVQGADVVALAGRREYFDRDRLSTCGLFTGYLDLGDTAHYR